MDKTTIRVLGVGNVLTSDDGLGPYTVKVLESRFNFPKHVEVIDIGTPGLDFTPYLSDAQAVIVLDTVHSAGPPGTIKLYRDGEIVASPPPSRMSPHEPGLREALMATELIDASPEHILLIGVVPETTEANTMLSVRVREAVPNVIDHVVEELERLGAKPTPKTPPDPLDIWWQ